VRPTATVSLSAASVSSPTWASTATSIGPRPPEARRFPHSVRPVRQGRQAICWGLPSGSDLGRSPWRRRPLVPPGRVRPTSMRIGSCAIVVGFVSADSDGGAAPTSLARPAATADHLAPRNAQERRVLVQARGPCCQLRVVSPQKTAVRPDSAAGPPKRASRPLPPGMVASTLAPGRGPSTRVQPSSLAAGYFCFALTGGEEAV